MGKLIVIEGIDSSGKTIQAHLLEAFFKKQGIPVKTMNFPRYHSFYGNMIARFLRGEFGSLDMVSPYLISIPYALDRASAKKEMEDFLKSGGYIIANRYTPSNMAHQGAKIKDPEKREEFVTWIYELEYVVNAVPKENVVLYLHIPWDTSMALSRKKEINSYLGTKNDIHEINEYHLQETERMYQYLAKQYNHWRLIECVQNDTLLPPEEIHAKILSALQFDIYP